MAKTDPAEFADAEIIKGRLDDLAAKLDAIIGHLEALQSSIENVGSRPQGIDPIRVGPRR